MWIIQSLIVVLCNSILYLAYKYFIGSGLDSSVVLVYVFMFGLPLYITNVKLYHLSLKLNITTIIGLFLIACIGFVANNNHLKAIACSPNPGYCAALVSAQIIVITIISYFLFKSEFTLIKGFGCLLTIIGAVLVSL